MTALKQMFFEEVCKILAFGSFVLSDLIKKEHNPDHFQSVDNLLDIQIRFVQSKASKHLRLWSRHDLSGELEGIVKNSLDMLTAWENHTSSLKTELQELQSQVANPVDPTYTNVHSRLSVLLDTTLERYVQTLTTLLI